MDKFLCAKRIDGLSSKTLSNYKDIINSFSGQMCKQASNISVDDIRGYIASMSNRNLKKSSLQTYINTLRSFFSWLTDEELIKKNPMVRIKSFKIDHKSTRHALSPDEMERLRDACASYKEKALVEFLVSSGCRLSEAIGIKLDDLNFKERSVVVCGKGNKSRTVYFSSRAKLMVETYIEQRHCGNSLFINGRRPHQGLKARTLQKTIQQIGERAKLARRIHPHLLRHTFATNAINSGMSITVIQQLLGHEDVGTTQIYATISKETIRHEYDKCTD